MKKNYLFGMALMASLAFFSCTNEVVYVHDGESSEQVSDEQIITLQVSNGGDGLTTRAGRPLYSSEAKQTIENVRLWIFDNEGTLKYSTTLENWNSTGSTEYGESNEHGREAKITLPGDNKLETGAGKTYTVYAIGYHSDSEYTDLATTLSSVDSENAIKDLVLTYSGDDNAEEIFAGSLEIDLTSATSTAFKQTIVLNRQVAGAFAYVKDIPYMDGAMYLKLVASAQNQSLVLGNFNSVDLANNGSNNGANVKYVVNGTNGKSGSETYEICTIDLTKWFKEIKDSDGDGLIDVTNWTNPLRPEGSPAAGTYPTFQKGSAFGGEFVIPFARVATKQTLTLQLTNVGGNLLRSWKVNLGSADEQLKQTITCWNSGFTDWSTSLSGESSNTYSLVRNHLYGIGTRMNDQADPENPGADPDPDPTPDPDDEPEPLNNKQELTLRVNDNWEVIHGMELE